MGCPKLTYYENPTPLKVVHNALKTSGKGCAGLYRYGFGGQEKVDEVSSFGNHYTAEFWEYDPRTGRRWNIDPVDQVSVSNYAVFKNNPKYFTDKKGDNSSPIYDEDFNFLGTDDEGLQGEAIVMPKSDFNQNMTHEEALKKGTKASDLPKVISPAKLEKLSSHYSGLKKRPDYDGVMTYNELVEWGKKNGDNPVFLDASKIDLGSLSVEDNFKNGIGVKTFINTTIYGIAQFTLIV